MKHALIFPGQGSQFSGMAKDLYDNNDTVKTMFNNANDILGFDIVKTMFEGSAEDLKQTKVTQPAIYLHSCAAFEVNKSNLKKDMVAGHSLGEFSALFANGALSFEDGLKLVSARAQAMQKACEMEKSTMAAVLALSDEQVEQLCEETEGIVVAANYNCPGQLVISGAYPAVEAACEKAKEMGARRALILPVGGAFHSPLMQPAQDELKAAIENTTFNTPDCAVYQNVNAKAVSNPEEIKENLVAQLTAAVRWTQSVQNMVNDGALHFTELGPGKVLQGLVKKIHREAETQGFQ